MPPRLNLVVLRSADLDVAEKFYCALGLQFDRHAHGKGPVHLASENAGQVFEIYPLGEHDAPTASARVGFVVPSVDDSYAALLAAGGKSVSPPKDSPWGRRAVVADPDGHRVELTQ
ncbi:VOC family protein [Blastopirellula marina]|uniref:Bleomycin resistance protein n=1 Tax=Blastopirellula marina TaxID=124 RepID=A0A2S8GTC4_9BACT|nr:VOC family protein [Blastopirellula marina]PQO47666.1 bleomycin resistance protein [Blastopirellula marina]